MQFLQASSDVQTERDHLVFQVFRYFRLADQPTSESTKITQLKQQDGSCVITDMISACRDWPQKCYPQKY